MAVLNINMPLFPTHQHSQEKTQIFTFRYTDLTKARVILILCPLFGKKNAKNKKPNPKLSGHKIPGCYHLFSVQKNLQYLF